MSGVHSCAGVRDRTPQQACMPLGPVTLGIGPVFRGARFLHRSLMLCLIEVRAQRSGSGRVEFSAPTKGIAHSISAFRNSNSLDHTPLPRFVRLAEVGLRGKSKRGE